MPETIELRDRTIIVTGGSSGIGAATARALHAAGARTVLAARRANRLQALAAELNGVLFVATDVTDAAQVDALIAATLKRYGRIDGLVNNAGVGLHDETVEKLDLVTFSRVFDLNVVSSVRLMQAVLPAMRDRRFGRIVNISSGTTTMVIPGIGAYAATKSALNMVSAVARKELAGTGIDVSLVLPSTTATEFAGGRFTLGQELGAGLVAHRPEYVAGVITRVLCTGEDRVDIPHGAERPELAGFEAG